MKPIGSSSTVAVRDSAPDGAPLKGAPWMPSDAALEGVRTRRSVAFVIDFCIIGVIWVGCLFAAGFVGLITFGLLLPPTLAALALIPLAYHTFLIGGADSATFGMRMMDVEIRTWSGGRPGLVQAFLHTALFYILTLPLLIVSFAVSLFNDRKRCLHDILCGTVAIRRGRS
jgi:uncharacterized RDD family membrane protein YckC